MGTSFALIVSPCALLIPRQGTPTWNRDAITATYVGAQLGEAESGNATLFLSYALQSHSDMDYPLTDGPGVIVMARLKPTGTLSSQEQVKLISPIFLPARQRARLTLQIAHPFDQATGHPLVHHEEQTFSEIFKSLAEVQSFVLFDQTKRVEIEFPSAWGELNGSAAARPATNPHGVNIGRIVIDAGHGGFDTGTIGPMGLIEKDVCLDIALRLGKLIQEDVPSAGVIYTRETDHFVTLEQRTEIANKTKADLFVSIHANSSHDAGVRGVETYYLDFNDSPQAVDAVEEHALVQNSVHHLEDLVEKITRKEKVARSHILAVDIQESLTSSLREGSRSERNRGVRNAPFVVLTRADMPSVLTEISFLSNPADEQWLMQPDNRQRVAEGLYRGIERYFLSATSVTTRISPSPMQVASRTPQ